MFSTTFYYLRHVRPSCLDRKPGAVGDVGSTRTTKNYGTMADEDTQVGQYLLMLQQTRQLQVANYIIICQ